MKKYISLFVLIIIMFPAYSQNYCDSLDFEYLGFSPFSDSTVSILVHNYSSEIFSYPGFALIDAQGDTIAKETVNYFGIGTYQEHTLQLFDTSKTTNYQNADLQLWINFYDTLLCSYGIDLSLCPDSCITIYPNIGNFGGAININTYHWKILDENLNPIHAGTFELKDTQQVDADTICLAAGMYSMVVDSYTHTGGQIYAGLGYQSPFFGAISMPALPDGTELSFSLLENCTTPSTDIHEVIDGNDLSIQYLRNQVIVNSKDNSFISQVSLFNSNGQLLFHQNKPESQIAINTRGLSIGVYFLLTESSGSWQYNKILIRQ